LKNPHTNEPVKAFRVGDVTKEVSSGAAVDEREASALLTGTIPHECFAHSLWITRHDETNVVQFGLTDRAEFDHCLKLLQRWAPKLLAEEYEQSLDSISEAHQLHLLEPTPELKCGTTSTGECHARPPEGQHELQSSVKTRGLVVYRCSLMSPPLKHLAGLPVSQVDVDSNSRRPLLSSAKGVSLLNLHRSTRTPARDQWKTQLSDDVADVGEVVAIQFVDATSSLVRTSGTNDLNCTQTTQSFNNGPRKSLTRVVESLHAGSGRPHRLIELIDVGVTSDPGDYA
jgi:hypothetical protein